MPSERGNSLLHTLLYQPQCQSCTVFQHLLSDLHLKGAQQQPRAINWWGGCWSCCHPFYGVMWPSPTWRCFIFSPTLFQQDFQEQQKITQPCSGHSLTESYISDPAVAGRRFLKWWDISCSESQQSFKGLKHPSHRSLQNWRRLRKSIFHLKLLSQYCIVC